tara:strand:+ start:2334 stop:2996 length:663 start_codon:yes stop_codon:yes gene_type:complete
MKNILCFGDSNTWGFVPGAFDPKTLYMKRYSIRERWPGLLRDILGEDFHIIEEGLNGRTTNVEYPDLSGRSGTSYILPCLYSHSPLDLVILNIGINDIKAIFDRSMMEISKGMSEIIDLIRSTSYGPDMQGQPQILLLSPSALIHEGYVDQNNESAFKGGMEKSLLFNDYYKKLALERDCHYVDLQSVVSYSKIDGLHYDKRGHAVVASIVASKINEIFT